jgi:TolA-binding protein
MQKYGKAIQYLDLTYNNYPSLDSRVEALLLKAFVLENKLNRKKEAKAAYQLLIKNHPDHKFAKDAKLILESLNPLP